MKLNTFVEGITRLAPAETALAKSLTQLSMAATRASSIKDVELEQISPIAIEHLDEDLHLRHVPTVTEAADQPVLTANTKERQGPANLHLDPLAAQAAIVMGNIAAAADAKLKGETDFTIADDDKAPWIEWVQSLPETLAKFKNKVLELLRSKANVDAK